VTTRDQQPGVAGNNGIRTDDAEVDPSHQLRIQVMHLDGTAAVTDSHSRPPSASRVIARTCSGR
jgi:hypothetical protein